MPEEKELQEKILAYRILESRLNSLLQQRDIVVSKILEIQTTLASIDEIKKSKKDVLFPLGSEAYTRGKVTSKNKLIVEIGAGIALEKTTKEGKKTLEERKSEFESALDKIQSDITAISSRMDKLGPEIKELSEKLEKPEG